MNESNVRARLPGALRYQEPLARHTSWRVGGPADRFYVPVDKNDLSVFLSGLEVDEPLIWLGLGSNLLVRDGGVRGTVIGLHGALNDLKTGAGSSVIAGAGVACAKVARFAAGKRLSGAEFLAGIPGTLGGALAMNAGAFGSETWELVKQVEVINRHGEIAHRSKQEFEIAYRSIAMSKEEWFIGAELELAAGDPEKSKQKIRAFLAARAASQPTGEFSCGSVFRNPPGDYAGRLIEAAGLKGKAMGQARVSDKHANFIINASGASAADIEALILHIQQAVKMRQKITLEPEVRIVGAKVNRDRH